LPSIDVFALGTCFTNFSGKQSSAANVNAMQRFAWLAKNNRTPDKWPTGGQKHPFHPAKSWSDLNSPKDAYAYAASVYETLWAEVTARLQLTAPILWVPVPSSDLDQDGIRTGARFPARTLAEGLVSRGLGSGVLPMLVWRTKHTPKTAGGQKRSAPDLFDELVVRVPPTAGHQLVFVDDLMTHGNHLAAMHARIPKARGAICIAFSHMNDNLTDDCYRPEVRTLSYDRDVADWHVSTTLRERLSIPVG
jgi:hypothetical protein